PDEYRQRFAQAALAQHPHVAVTLEVLEIAGRPAVLQEWLSGLASTDWPPFVAVPGVWLRLGSQAAQALPAAHAAGPTHGHLHAGLLVLTEVGVLKLCGLGEPRWLAPAPRISEDGPAADLAALGRLAGEWATAIGPAKPGKAKGLPAALRAVLDRLNSADPDTYYPTAAELLADLERAGPAVPAHPEAWERLVRHVGEHAMTAAELRQSAGDALRLTHPHETAVVLAGQRPKEGAHVGAFVEEADCVDLHARLAGGRGVPARLQHAADV